MMAYDQDARNMKSTRKKWTPLQVARAHAQVVDTSRLRDLQHCVRDPPLLALLRARSYIASVAIWWL